MSGLSRGFADRTTRITILVALTLAIALLHFVIPTDTHAMHKLHIVVRKLYFVPPAMAAAWFGLRGAIWTAFAVSALFSLHALHDWPGNYMEQANQFGELLGFWFAGVIPGALFDRQRALLRQLATANAETLDSLVAALDLREHQTGMHSRRVRAYTLLTADRLGVSAPVQRVIGDGALLHDIGKIAVPDDILRKPGGLTPAEWHTMRQHPAAGYRILTQVGFLRAAAEIVYAHHERYDGCGYPRGLAGETIPFGARLFMVADVFDALTSERPYRSPMPMVDALDVIRDGSGTQFDPIAVDAFLSLPPQELEAVAARFREAPLGEVEAGATAPAPPTPLGVPPACSVQQNADAESGEP